MDFKSSLLVFGVVILMITVRNWNRRQWQSVEREKKEMKKTEVFRSPERISETGSAVKWVIDDGEPGERRPGGSEPPTG